MKPAKEEMLYRYWRGWLQEYGMSKYPDFDTDDFDEDILREMYANGYSTVNAYKELLSELPKKRSKERV